MNGKIVNYLSSFKGEALAGLTVSFAMVPEVVGFSFVAGVNPLTGLYAAFVAGLITALIGGRPGMITGGAGSLAVVSASLVAAHGPQYLFAAVALMGAIQAAVGLLRWGKFIQLVPQPVMMGFVNGLATVIFLAQVHRFQVHGADGALHWMQGPALWVMLGLAALTVAITYALPRVTKVVPSPLVAIIVVTAIVHIFHLPAVSVRDLAQVHGGWPLLHIPMVPFTGHTLQIIFPYAILLAGVGLSETLLTQILVDTITQTRTSNDKECVGQGLANIATGFFAGMGGCAMIAQTMLNLESGGRGRLSGVIEALCIVAFIVCASGLIGMIPMAALVGVMFVVVAKTFAWSSFRILGKIPRADAFALILVSVVTVFTNLAIAVAVGVVFCALNFAWANATRLKARRYKDQEGRVVYEIHGPLFFGSTQAFKELFDPKRDTPETTVDLRYTYLHDHSAISAAESIAERYAEEGKKLRMVHLSQECQGILARTNSILHWGEPASAHRHVSTDALVLTAGGGDDRQGREAE